MFAKKIKLPESEDMMRRLTKATDTAHLRENFYPLLCCELASKELSPADIAKTIATNKRDYLQDKHPAYQQVISNLVMPRLITAIIDNIQAGDTILTALSS